MTLVCDPHTGCEPGWTEPEWSEVELAAWVEDQVAREAGAADVAAGVVGAPASFDNSTWRDEDLLEARGVVSEWDLPLLASNDPTTLDRVGRQSYLRRVEAVEALVASLRVRGTVAIAGVDGSDSMVDRHAAMEVAQLRRVGEGAAATSIATSRSLQVDFPLFLAALGAGEVSEWHCRELVAGTCHVSDAAVIAALQGRLLPKAKRATPGEFRREVRKAVVDLDAERAAERVARARAERYVSCRPLEDGMGFLGVVSDWPTIHAMHATITAEGRVLQLERGGAQAARAGDDDALADACRADVFATRVLGHVAEDGSLVWNRSETHVTLTVVMDLDTLRGEADRHALIDGEPMPAGIGRQVAETATRWRRAVTDPVTGHLLDYGREQYLPERLRDYILARDHCRVPGCTTRATSQLEMDHVIPFPDGQTSAANCGGLCRTHHRAKTEHRAHLTDTAPDGSATWTTAWGQTTRISPRPYLHDPIDHTPTQDDPHPDPPGVAPPF